MLWPWINSTKQDLCPVVFLFYADDMLTSTTNTFFIFYFQDFELWDDVGLNIPKPPDLLQLYRNCGAPLPSPRDTVDVSVGVDFGDLPGNCIAQEPPKKPDLSQQVCLLVWFMAVQFVMSSTFHPSMSDCWLYFIMSRSDISHSHCFSKRLWN